jgi:hypothetical protein
MAAAVMQYRGRAPACAIPDGVTDNTHFSACGTTRMAGLVVQGIRELLDGTHIDKYGTGGDTRLLTGSGVRSINGTKSNPGTVGRPPR